MWTSLLIHCVQAKMASTNLPTRTATSNTEDDAIPDEDTGEVARLFNERLSAWKHAAAYLESYVESTEKMQHAQGKEYEKVLKVGLHTTTIHNLPEDLPC